MGATSGRLAKSVAIDIAAAAAASAFVLVLLLYLHGRVMLPTALAGGVLSGVLLRRFFRGNVEQFPPFLRRPLSVGIVVIGCLVAAWGSLATYSPAYWLLRWKEAAELLAAAGLLGLALTAAVYTHGRLRHEVEEARAREAAQAQAALRAQLSALQAQVNPHFLFNALNVVAETAHEDPDLAERLIGDISHLLRYSLRSSSVSTVPLSQEVEAVERYLEVERARFGDRLRSRVSLADDARAWPVPGLLLQPLVENSVRHAVGPSARGGSVTLDARVEDGALRVVVEDDGPGLPPDVRERVARASLDPALLPDAGTGGAGGGLSNVARRLALAYGGRGRLEVSERAGGGARFDLRVPAP